MGEADNERDLQKELLRSRDRYRKLASRRSVRLALALSRWLAPVAGLLRRSPSPADSGDSAPRATDRSGSDGLVLRSYDFERDAHVRRNLLHRYSQDGLSARSVTVILPTFNREDTLGRAIDSVLAQTHRNFELLVVDDGSTDGTSEVLGAYDDDRMTVLTRGRGGVGAARNAALDVATGDVIAFLDSDNWWDPEYLALAVAALDPTAEAVGYCGLSLERSGEVVGYRGREWDRSECAKDNFVDLNGLFHVRFEGDHPPRFDPALRRLNDWDYLLRITQIRDARYHPFLGVHYSWEERDDQLTRTEPNLYRRIVQYRHGRPSEDHTDLAAREIFDRIPLRFSIRTAVPQAEREVWGDYHFALGLAQAFERRGHDAEILYREDPPPNRRNVVISLRGLVRHRPVPHCVNVLWNISHPDLVGFDEIDEFDLYFSASPTWHASVSWATGTSCHSLLQATDRAEFFPCGTPVESDAPVVFVGNSRAADRWVVRAAADSEANLQIFGGGWEGRVPERFVVAEHIAHHDLPRVYARAGAVLNDHWPSMRDFGLISNRLFDAAACAAPVVSDDVVGIDELFGGLVTSVDTEADVAGAVERARHLDRGDLADLAHAVTRQHSFDDRAASLLAHIRSFALESVPAASFSPVEAASCPHCTPIRSYETGVANTAAVPASRQLTLSLVTGDRTTDDTFRRIVQPLTSPLHGFDVTVVPIDVGEPVRGDAVIVPGELLGAAIDDDRLAALTTSGIPVVIDAGDGADFDEFVARVSSDADPAIDPATFAAVTELWLPEMSDVSDMVPVATQILRTGSDQRLWRTYRTPRNRRKPGERPRVLLEVGPSAPSSLGVLEALVAMADAGSIELVVVGQASTRLPEASTYTMIEADETEYPRRARALRTIVAREVIDIIVAVDGDDEVSTDRRLRSDEIRMLGALPIMGTLSAVTAELERLAGASEVLAAAKALMAEQALPMTASEAGEALAERLWALTRR